MRISKISIKNFRSLADVSIDPKPFNILVGRNNHGKSNLLAAVEWFYTGRGELENLRRHGAASDNDLEVEIEFAGVQKALAHISNKDNQQKIQNIIGNDDVMRVRRTGEDSKTRYIFNRSKAEWQRQPAGADSAFNNCLPRFEFVLTDKSLAEVSAFKASTPIGQMLGGIISGALEKERRYVEFKEKFEELFQAPDSSIQRLLHGTSQRVAAHLMQQFPDCTAVDFKVEIPPFDEFLRGYSTTVDDGVMTHAEEKGDGMQRALMLAIIKAHADVRRDEALGRAFIFFIDEAELHLHPAAQRQLKGALSGLADGVDQVFITTHSSVFLSESSETQAEFVVEKEGQETSVLPISETARMRTIYDLLGGHPTDLLLPANFLIVEGPSEVEFLNRVCARFYCNKPRIQIVAAGGDDGRQAQYLSAIMKCFAPLGSSPIYGKRAVLLCDSPTGTEKERRLESFLEEHKDIRKGERIHILPTTGLEEYYPKNLRDQCGNISNKKRLAMKIGGTVSQQEFEQEMSVIFSALKMCWEKSH